MFFTFCWFNSFDLCWLLYLFRSLFLALVVICLLDCGLCSSRFWFCVLDWFVVCWFLLCLHVLWLFDCVVVFGYMIVCLMFGVFCCGYVCIYVLTLWLLFDVVVLMVILRCLFLVFECFEVLSWFACFIAEIVTLVCYVLCFVYCCGICCL